MLRASTARPAVVWRPVRSKDRPVLPGRRVLAADRCAPPASPVVCADAQVRSDPIRARTPPRAMAPAAVLPRLPSAGFKTAVSTPNLLVLFPNHYPREVRAT